MKQKETVKFTPPIKDEKAPPPPPPVKVPDLSSYKVGDKYIDGDGREWIVESVNPPKLKTILSEWRKPNGSRSTPVNPPK